MKKSGLLGLLTGFDPQIRDLTNSEFRSLVTADAGATIPDDHTVNFIDAFPDRSIIVSLGGTFLSGINLKEKMPKIVKANFSDVDYSRPEVADVPEIAITFVNTENIAPKRYGAWARISKQLSVQANPDLERYLNNQFSIKIINEVEEAFFAELSTTIGVTTIAGALSHATLNSMETAVDVGNEFEATGFAANPADLPKLKSLEAVGGSLLYKNGRLNGERLLVSKVVPLGVLFFGKWSNVQIMQFNKIEILKDVFTLANEGYTRLVINSFFDWNILAGSDFSKLAI